MQVADNSVVFFHYELRNDQNEVVDTTEGEEPIPYIHGKQQIVPGLEEAMLGHKAGDKFDVCVPPEKGYGLHDEDKLFDVDRALFAGMADLAVGSMCEMTNEQGQPEVVTVAEIGDEVVTVDANHPFAGQVLTFAIEITSVREATETELENGIG